MAVESIGSVLNQTDNQQTQQASIGQEDLFEILLTQLTYQDPLKPLDNQEFIAQLAQFTSLEQTRQSTSNLESLLTMNTSNQAINLIGRTVHVATSTGTEIGDVTTVTFERGVPQLTVYLTGKNTSLPNISLSQISLVRAVNSPDAQSVETQN